MVKFKTKLFKNKRNKQVSLHVPSWLFKNEMLDFEEDSEYWVDISKIEKEDSEKDPQK